MEEETYKDDFFSFQAKSIFILTKKQVNQMTKFGVCDTVLIINFYFFLITDDTEISPKLLVGRRGRKKVHSKDRIVR